MRSKCYLRKTLLKIEVKTRTWQTLPSYLGFVKLIVMKKDEVLTPPNNVTPSFILPAIAPDLQR